MVNKSEYKQSLSEALNKIILLNTRLYQEQKYLQINRVLSQFIYSITCVIMYLDNKICDEFDEVLFICSIYQSLNRNFVTEIFIALELEINLIRSNLDENEINCGLGKKYSKLLTKLESILKKEISSYQTVLPIINKLKEYEKKHPEFDDYLNSLLKIIANKNCSYKKESRKFFAALKVIRNKMSHSNLSLSDNEIDIIKKSPLNLMVESRCIQINVLFCPIIAENIILFLDRTK